MNCIHVTTQPAPLTPQSWGGNRATPPRIGGPGGDSGAIEPFSLPAWVVTHSLSITKITGHRHMRLRAVQV